MERNVRKTKKGVVVGHKMDKTAVVQIERTFAHPKYRKVVKSTKKFLVDDPKNISKVGDKVEIIETRPISKTKFHRILSVVGQVKVKVRELPKKSVKGMEKESDTAAN